MPREAPKREVLDKHSAFDGVGANLWQCNNCHAFASPPKFVQTPHDKEFSALIYCVKCYEELGVPA